MLHLCLEEGEKLKDPRWTEVGSDLGQQAIKEESELTSLGQIKGRDTHRREPSK